MMEGAEESGQRQVMRGRQVRNGRVGRFFFCFSFLFPFFSILGTNFNFCLNIVGSNAIFYKYCLI